MSYSQKHPKTVQILDKLTENKEEQVSAYSSYIDPEVTKISNKIAETIENHKIKPSGNLRPKSSPPEEPPIINIEKEAVSISFIDKNTLEEIKKIAAQYPLTNDLITHSKSFFQNNQKMVNKQMEELVALYSIKDKKPFFFISPSEARLAIDYVKKVRSGFIQEQKEIEKQDNIVKEFIKQKKFLQPQNLIASQGLQKILDSNNNYQLSYHFNHNTFTYFSLDSINKMFAFLETLTERGLTVDIIIMSAIRFADIRNMGRNIYDEYATKESIKRGVFGKLFTADIYLCNDLKNNDIITGNSTTNTFVLNVIQYPEN